MLKMSDICKKQMINEFGFTNSELLSIEEFMNDNNHEMARDILDTLIKSKTLNCKQKIIVSYIVGTSAEAARDKEKDIIIEPDMSKFAG